MEIEPAAADTEAATLDEAAAADEAGADAETPEAEMEGEKALPEVEGETPEGNTLTEAATEAATDAAGEPETPTTGLPVMVNPTLGDGVVTTAVGKPQHCVTGL